MIFFTPPSLISLCHRLCSFLHCLHCGSELVTFLSLTRCIPCCQRCRHRYHTYHYLFSIFPAIFGLKYSAAFLWLLFGPPPWRRHGPLLTPLRHKGGCPLYSGPKTCTQSETPTWRLCLIPWRPHYESGDCTSECLPITTWRTPGSLSSALRWHAIRSQ